MASVQKEILGRKMPMEVGLQPSKVYKSTYRPSYTQQKVVMRDGLKGPAPSTPKSFWASKPAWCQPWSILSTGSLVIAAVNRISDGSLLWTSLIALPVVAWWLLFLILVPSAYAQDPGAFASIDVVTEDDARNAQR